MSRSFTMLLLTFVLVACGGGGGGSSGSTPAPQPPPVDPGDNATQLAVVDAMPGAGVTNAEPAQAAARFSHLGHSDLDVTLSADCTDFSGATIRRTLLDLAANEFDQLLEHHVRCTFDENTAYKLTANGTRSNEATFFAEQSFSTGVTNPSSLTVMEESVLPQSSIDDMFLGYVGGALFDELDLSSGVELLVLGAITEIAEANWDNLVNPEALYDVTSQRLSYLSRQPDGSPAMSLTGLVAFPVTETTPSFVPRDRVIILTHATGSTPGNLDSTDAWYILANQFAARGYLVIAPDNYGRGGTSAEPETYLLAGRTALNTLDLVEQVLADSSYDAVYSGTEVTIIGYSQGGHSAIALWQAMHTQGPANLQVREVYAGGAPHNLYQTVRGVMQHLDGSCEDGAYCRYVDEDTTVPFATDRILPGLLSYTDTGLELADVVSGNTIDPAFVSGFLSTDAGYDKLKILLQQNSFTRMANVAEVFGSSPGVIHLYHSSFDRLVPSANTEELAELLQPVVNVDFHESRCNGTGYQLIFNTTDKVGALHTLCGLTVLDAAMEDLK